MSRAKKRYAWRTLIALAIVAILSVPLLKRGYTDYFKALYPDTYRETVNAEAEAFGIPPSLVMAVIHTESDFQPEAQSSAGALGLMQFTEDTFNWAAKRLGENGKYTFEDLKKPEISIHYGAYLLSYLLDRWEIPETALAAYNAGSGRVSSWLADSDISADGVHLDTIPYKETADYVKRVTEAQNRYQTLYAMK